MTFICVLEQRLPMFLPLKLPRIGASIKFKNAAQVTLDPHLVCLRFVDSPARKKARLSRKCLHPLSRTINVGYSGGASLRCRGYPLGAGLNVRPTALCTNEKAFVGQAAQETRRQINQRARSRAGSSRRRAHQRHQFRCFMRVAAHGWEYSASLAIACRRQSMVRPSFST